jgi:hypothetical protein
VGKVIPCQIRAVKNETFGRALGSLTRGNFSAVAMNPPKKIFVSAGARRLGEKAAVGKAGEAGGGQRVEHSAQQGQVYSPRK